MSIGALNSRTLNSETLDGGTIFPAQPTIENLCLGEFNAQPFNELEVNGCIFYSVLIPQTIISINQIVGSIVSGTILELVQSQELRIDVSGTIASIVQNVKTTITSQTTLINQLVTSPNSFLNTYGFDTAISINGAEIPKSGVCSDIVITKESNQNTLCEFKVLSSVPLEFINNIDGGTVQIDYYDSNGGHRIFTGKVDVPEIDLVNKWITIKCNDRRSDLIKSKLQSSLPTLGRYSPTIQGEITSVEQEVEYRLQTVSKDVDFDAYNNLNINSWYAKATADYLFNNSDVYYREPKISLQSRADIINSIDVEVKYQYPRLYHYQRPFNWTTSASEPLLAIGEHPDGYSFPTVGMIKQAIEGAGWRENDTLNYSESLSNYWVTYSMAQPNTMRPYVGGAAFGLVRVPMIHHLENIDQYEVLSASWDGSTRFAQTVEETYTLSVSASQSISQYGSITGFAKYNLQADYDTNTWENYRFFTPTPDDAVISDSSYYVDRDINVSDKTNAVLTAIDKAKIDILASHRNTIVSFETPIVPNLELRHTLEVDTTRLSCKGKVRKIIHTINLLNKKGHSTTIEVALFRSAGTSVTDDSLCPPKPSDIVSIPNSTITLGNHLGYDFDSMSSSITNTWNGFIGNTIDPPTQFTEKFIVDTPSAPDHLRELRSLSASDSFNIEIPNDDLDINF